MIDHVDRTTIINTLADKLPDSILKELFPAIPTTAVRDVLLGEKKSGHATGKTAEPVHRAGWRQRPFLQAVH